MTSTMPPADLREIGRARTSRDDCSRAENARRGYRFVALHGVVALLCWFGPLTSEPSLAQGGPPMLTDDPETPGARRWEINTAYTELRTNQEHLRSFPHVDINYGLGEHIQLKFETGWVFADSPDGVKS